MSNEIQLKAREQEILRRIAEGMSNGEIGAQLHLSNETVRWYNKQIFEKLGASNRTQAVARARELGLLDGAEKSVKPVLRVSRSPVRYVANSNVHIAYQVVGEGPIDLLFIHGFLSHLELAWENPEFTNFFEQLGRFARVILFDKRGIGLSDRIQGAATVENTIEDACRVLDAVGSESAYVMGTSEGGAAAVLLASTYPERVRGLVLYAAIPKMVQTNGEPEWADSPEQFEQLLEDMQSSWGGPWAIESFAPSRARDEQFRAWWAMVLRSASSPSSIQAVLTNLRDLDIRPLLPQIRVKTLVLHKTHDRVADVAAGHYFATHMPNAAWVELTGADHIYFVESTRLVSAVEQFCKTETPAEADTWIAIVMYIAADGDARVLKEVSSHLKTHRPRRVSVLGADIIALFDSPARAIQCAKALYNAQKSRFLKISLHVGECNVKDGKPADTVLQSARQAAETIAPGEILITRTLRDILGGSEFEFQAHGETGYLIRTVNADNN